ncbi:MAG: hypothetical protein QME21_18285 [Anaerolineales bacterium]|nr:hypothetical protein [Anaerolineales bacterium]
MSNNIESSQQQKQPKPRSEKPAWGCSSGILSVLTSLATVVACYFTVATALVVGRPETLYLVVPFAPTPPPQIVEVTVPVQVIQEAEVTREITREVTREVTKLFEILITPSPFPPSPTPRPTSTIEPALLMHDDFSQGLSPSWRVVDGNAIVVNNMLTVDQQTWLVVGEPGWTDYVIEFDNVRHTSNSLVAVRIQDLDNMIVFVWGYSNSWWEVVTNGVWKEVPNTRSGFIGGPPRSFKITVEGDKFTASIGDRRLSSFFNSSYFQGYVGIRLASETLIDNVRITAINK